MKSPLPLLLLVVALPAPAVAFNSTCYVQSGEHCSHFDGYGATHNRWFIDGVTTGSTDAEHTQIWNYALERSGLPLDLLEEFNLRQFSTRDELPWADAVTDPSFLDGIIIELDGFLENGPHESWAPVSFGPSATRNRTMTIGEFAQLPDFSWSLWDWAMANETCPAFDGEPADQCHLFATHMGALNSSHFLPQSADWYSHYHALALARAAECAALWDDLPEAARARFEPRVQLCEKEALVLEAIGHHFLQDAWSMGHMWERWGSSSIEHFDWVYEFDSAVTSEDDLNIAKAVGAFAGAIHGAKSVTNELSRIMEHYIDLGLEAFEEAYPSQEALLEYLGVIDSFQLVFDDPMCFPYDDDVGYQDPFLGERLLAGGDYTWTTFILGGGGPAMNDQLEALLGCSVDGMRQVYEATAMRSGALGDADALSVDTTRSVDSIDACFGQRADNEAIMTGFGIHYGGWPDQVPVIGSTGAAWVWIAQYMVGMSYAEVLSSLSMPSLSIAQSAEFAYDAVLIGASLVLYGQDEELKTGTNMSEMRVAGTDGVLGTADDEYLDLLGMLPNSHYPGVGEYADPALPWNLLDDDAEVADQEQALNLAFADAHAADRCDELGVEDLELYRTAVALGEDVEARVARCGQCVQMVVPHLRMGAEGSHDEDLEPLCHYVNEGPYLYTGALAGSLSVTGAARDWCGCASRLAVLVDGAAPGVQLWELEGGALIQVGMPPWADDVLPTDGKPRDIAVGGPSGELAFVPGGAGFLHIFDLTEGEESEVDLGSVGEGFVRYEVGSGARGVAALHSLPYVVVATEDDIVLFNTTTLEEHVRVPAATLGLTGPDRPWDVEVTSDDAVAFVSVFGSLGDPANTVLMLDLEAIVDGATDPTVVLDAVPVGGSTNPQWMALSRGGAQLAVALFSQDRVAVIDTATGDVVDVNSAGNIEFFQPDPLFDFSLFPKAVGWSGYDDAVYAGFVGGNTVAFVPGDLPPRLSGHGVVRRCPFAAEKCHHEVGVEGNLEDMVVIVEGVEEFVLVGDSLGNLTILSGDLFVPTPSTVGKDGRGNYDGTGGCLDGDRAEPCPATINVGQSIAKIAPLGG